MPFLGGLISGAGSLLGGIFGGNAASDAASKVAAAENRAAEIQFQEWQQTQQNLLPFLQTGQAANQSLAGLLGFSAAPGGGYTFTNSNSPLLMNPQSAMGPAPTYNMPAFTAGMYQQSPGYNAQLQGATQALQNAGTTTTGPQSGNVLAALAGTGTQMANQNYQQAYQNYATNYGNQFGANNANYWNTLGQSNAVQQNIFNRLNTLSGSGQNAGASLGALGSTAATNIGNAYIGAGSAQAAGVLGQQQAWQSAGNNLMNLFNSPAGGGGGGSTNLQALIASLTGSGGGAPAWGDASGGY